MRTSLEAFQLLSLPKVTLSYPGCNEQGTLELNYVTVSGQDVRNNRDTYLVMRVNMSEIIIDPATTIQCINGSGARTYKFSATEINPDGMELIVSLPGEKEPIQIMDILDLFESILSQYAELRGSLHSSADYVTPIVGMEHDHGKKDLRGHLVMINEDSGEVIGEVEDRFRIHEDPLMHEKGHESDPVVIEVSDEQLDGDFREVFARIIPPDQQNWVTKSASMASRAISMSTNLLVTTLNAASSYYVAHSSPSPHHSSTASSEISRNASTSPQPPPLPPRALVFLTSERTRKGLSTVHAMSGEAVKISAKTVGVIDDMIRKAIGAQPKRVRTEFIQTPSPSSSQPGLSAHQRLSRSPSPSYNGKLNIAPPPYSANQKPPLPPRRSPSPVPPPIPRTESGIPLEMMQAPQPKLTTKDRLLISADLILSTIDDSARKIFDVSSESIGKVVGHKYGPEAANSSLLMTGTARNVGLIYIDMRGMGRRALLRKAGKTFVKGRMQSVMARPPAIPNTSPPAAHEVPNLKQ